jgi:tetratricopeptide (TPR) repeat protein
MGFRNWFTLFFIPVFPISGRSPYCQCPGCGAQFPGAAADLRRELAGSEQRQSQEAIALYNSLRASPANSVALNQLLALYGSLKDYDAAVAAVNEFPQALNSSEQCMVTLGRVLLAQERHAEAVRWFEAATARNGMLGEALYYKALALLESTPPDRDLAVTAARAARSAGYPNADRLLKEAEERRRQA